MLSSFETAGRRTFGDRQTFLSFPNTTRLGGIGVRGRTPRIHLFPHREIVQGYRLSVFIFQDRGRRYHKRDALDHDVAVVGPPYHQRLNRTSKVKLGAG